MVVFSPKQTFRDLQTILWLKRKHLKSSLRRIAYVFATDIVEDRDLGERLYQVYAVSALAVCLFLIWLASLDGVIKMFATLSSSFFSALIQASPLFPLLTFIISGCMLLRSCPIHLQYPDISYLASSQIRVSVIVFTEFLGHLISYSVVSFLVFYLIGTGLQANLTYSFDPLIYSLSISLYIACAFLLTWILGIFRFRAKRKKVSVNSILGIILFVVFTILFLTLFALSSLEKIGLTVSFFTTYTLSLAMPIVLFILGFSLLLLLSKNITMLYLIEDNSLFAETYPLRHMMFTNSQSYREIIRKKKLAHRFMQHGVPKFCSIGTGFTTFITRDLLSLRRQYKSIFILIIWGAFVASLAITLITQARSPLSWALLILTLLTFPKGVWETTRIYRSDMQNQMFRSLIPYDPLTLLIRDALPSLVIVSLTSVVAVLVLSTWGMNPIEGIILSILLNIILTLCNALEEVRVSNSRLRLSYELSMLISFAIFVPCVLANLGLGLIVLSILIILLSHLLKQGEG